MTGERLDAIFAPRSIAVIGASRYPGKIGYEILHNRIVNDFQGILIRMIESIRTAPILRGVRGEPPRDVSALQEAILRLAQIVSDFDAIQEVDLNPVLVLPSGQGYRVVDARVIHAMPPDPASAGPVSSPTAARPTP